MTTRPSFIQNWYDDCNVKVKYWLTFNEPHVMTRFGYTKSGVPFPPGAKNSLDPYVVIDNVLRSHAAAYHAYHNDFYSQQKGC